MLVGVWEEALGYAGDLANLRASLPEPTDVHDTVVANPYCEGTNNAWTRTIYPTLATWTVYSGCTDAEALAVVYFLTSDSLPPALAVGSVTRSELEALLGPPARTREFADTTELSYELPLWVSEYGFYIHMRLLSDTLRQVVVDFDIYE